METLATSPQADDSPHLSATGMLLKRPRLASQQSAKHHSSVHAAMAANQAAGAWRLASQAAQADFTRDSSGARAMNDVILNKSKSCGWLQSRHLDVHGEWTRCSLISSLQP